MHHLIEILACVLLKYKNGQFYTYCINMYGIIHQNERVNDLFLYPYHAFS